MLHQRIASEIRDHFSTVGPSPLASSNSKSPQSTSLQPAAPGTNPVRPFLLPVPFTTIKTDAGARSSQPSISYDLLATIAHRSASFFAEAAVLVLVLGILDRFLASNRIELRWISGAFLIATGLLAAAIVTDVTARRWLRAH